MEKISQIGWGLVIAALGIGFYVWWSNSLNPVTSFPPTVIFFLGAIFLMSPYLPVEERRDAIAESVRFIVAGAGGGLAAELTFENNSPFPITIILIAGVLILLLFTEMVLRLSFHYFENNKRLVSSRLLG